MNLFQFSNGAGGFISDDQITFLPSEDRVRFGFGDGTGALEIGSPGANGIRISSIGGEDTFTKWVGSDKHSFLFVAGTAVVQHRFGAQSGFVSHWDATETFTQPKTVNAAFTLNGTTKLNRIVELADCSGAGGPESPPAASYEWGWDVVNACLSFCGHTKAGVWGWQCATPWGG